MSEENQIKKKREAVAKELWLIYFNNVLYEKGLITECQRNQMKNKITIYCKKHMC